MTKEEWFDPLPAVVSELGEQPQDSSPAWDLPFNVDLLPALIVDALLPPLPPRPPEADQPVFVFEDSTPIPSPAPDKSDLLHQLEERLRNGQNDTRATLASIGNLLLEQKCYDEAMPVFEELVMQDPGDPRAQTGLGRCLERRGRWGEAAARYRMALDADPAAVVASSGLGYCMLRLDDTALALNQFDRCLAVAPSHVPALVGKAVCLQLTGNAEKADHLYNEALRLDPSMHGTLAPLMEKPPASVAAFRSAARLHPDSAEAWQSLAMALHHRSDIEGAKAAYAAALDICMELPESLWNFGLLLEQSGKPQESSEMFLRLVQIDPARQHAWFRLAEVQARTGDLEGALAACRKCPDVVGGVENPHALLGMLCWRCGDYAAAARCFEEMVAREPKSPAALRAAGAATIRLGDYRRALELHRRLNEGGDSSFEVLCNRAGLETRVGGLTAAIAYFRQAASASPESEDAAIGLAMARRALLDRPGF